MAGKHPLLIWLYILHVITLIAAFFIAASFIFILYGSISSLVSTSGSSITQVWFEIGISIYGILFAISLILIEMKITWFMNDYPAFLRWSKRGFYYIFVGLLVVATTPTFSTGNQTIDENLPSVTFAVGIAVIIIGCLYIIMQLLCCHDRAAKLSEKAGEGAIV